MKKCDRLGMRPAAMRSRAPADDLAARDDDTANVGIGRTSPAGAIAQAHRFGHEARVGAHIPSCFSSFWNCRCFSLAAASRFA